MDVVKTAVGRLCHVQSAVYIQGDAVYIFRQIRGEKDRSARHVLRCTRCGRPAFPGWPQPETPL